MNRHRTLSAATMAALGISTASHAYIVFDQFGDLSTIGGRANPCQRFPDAPAFDIASLDDFTLSGGVGALTSVETLVVEANGFTSIGNVQAWSVEIYSSVANAATSLSGNVLSATFAAGASPVSVTPVFTQSYLVQLDISGLGVSLGDGTYWISIIPRMPFGGGGGQIGVWQSGVNDGPSASPNAHYANPGLGFGVGASGLWLANGNPLNLAYRIHAVPAPAALTLLGLAGLAGSRRRR